MGQKKLHTIHLLRSSMNCSRIKVVVAIKNKPMLPKSSIGIYFARG